MRVLASQAALFVLAILILAERMGEGRREDRDQAQSAF